MAPTGSRLGECAVKTFWSLGLIALVAIPCFVALNDSDYLRFLTLVMLFTTFRLSAELSELRARL
jgi:hypothetical protein